MAVAADRPIMPTESWKGSVDNEVLLGKPPLVIAGATAWQTLWKDWRLEGKTPDVDFTKQLVIAQTTRGSVLNVSAKLTDEGDLKVIGIATRDLRPGFRYVLWSVSREGVKTVDGQPLPKDEGQQATITGQVIGPKGAKLEPGMTVKVQLLDVSLQDAAAVVLGEQIIRDAKAFPIRFRISYDAAKTNPRLMYGIGVRIEKEGRLRFINDTRIAVISDGAPTRDVDAPVIQVQ
jgi:putative lipoprotein